MKFLPLVLAASMISFAAAAQENLEPLIIEINMDQISCNGLPYELDDIEDLVGKSDNEHIVIMSDTQTEAVMVLALKDAIQRGTTSEITLIVPGSSLLEKNRFFDSVSIYPGHVIDLAPLTNAEYYGTEDLKHKEFGTIPVFLLDEKGISRGGKSFSNTAEASNAISCINSDKFAPVVIVKVAATADILDLFNFEEYVRGEITSIGRADKIRVLYAFPDTRVTESCLVQFIPDDDHQFVVKTVEEDDPNLKVKPVFNANGESFARYLQSIINTNDYEAGRQGRVFIEYTVMFDGSLGEVKALAGFEDLYKAVYNAAAKMPALWTPGRMEDGSLVNVHYKILPIHVTPHL